MQFWKEAARQARALFPNTSRADIEQDLQDIVTEALKIAVARFPNNAHRQDQYVETRVSEALRRKLGRLEGGTVH